MNLLPTHLRHLAANPAREDGLLTMTLRCPCGSTGFRLEQAVPGEAEQAAIDAWRAAERALYRGHIFRMRRDYSGQMVLMRRRFFFGRWEPVKPLLPPPPCYMDVLALRGTCRSCGKTHLIYDNRVHGFDALMGEFVDEAMSWQPRWQEIAVPEGACIRVELSDDAQSRLQEMREFIPGFTPEMACEAFECIEVWSMIGDRHGEILFDAP